WMPLRGDTVLRILQSTPAPPQPTPRVLGIDDFALRKGRVSGTILVDLEQQRPIDLLPERTADTVATWLRAHPAVEVIARDRASGFRRRARRRAPGGTPGWQPFSPSVEPPGSRSPFFGGEPRPPGPVCGPGARGPRPPPRKSRGHPPLPPRLSKGAPR